MNSFEPSRELQENYYGKDLVTKSNWYSSVAEIYAKVRPAYSDRIIDLAIKQAQLSSNCQLLEIGCGPGIATISFARRGFSLVSLEPNPVACQLAKNKCAAYPNVTIEQTTLEEWTVTPQQFDAVVAATSIHWVSPEIGYPKIAQALKANGSLILLWNAGLQLNETVNELLKPIYATYAPSLKPFQTRAKEKEQLNELGKTVIDSGYFTHVVSEEFNLEVNYSIKDYLLLLSTYSPYIALEVAQRQNLFTAIDTCLTNNLGESILLSYLSMLQVFRLNKREFNEDFY